MYLLTEIKVEDFDPGAKSEAGRFKVVSPCADPKSRFSAEVLSLMTAMEHNDQRQAVLGLKHFLKLAQMGRPLSQLVDESTVHEAFEPFYCSITKKYETVWRYRHGVIRILFYYSAGKVMLLAHALAKRKDKLTKKEMAEATKAVEDFLMALHSKAGLQWVD